MIKYVAEFKDDRTKFNQIVSSGVITSLFLGFGFVALFYFSSGLFADIFNMPGLSGLLKILSPVFPFALVGGALLGLLNGLRERWEMSGFKVRCCRWKISLYIVAIADVIYEMKDMQIQKKYRGAVEEFVRRVLERYRDKIDSIILFGSVARGEAKEDSDIDVLIVIKKEDFKLRRALIGVAFDILLETGSDISVKVLSKNEFEDRRDFSFLRNIISEGVKLA